MNSETQQNGARESLVRRVMFNEVALAAGVVGVAFGIFNMLQTPRTDIEIIKALNTIRDNDLHAIEGKIEAQDQKIQGLQASMVEIRTILDERLPR